MKVFNSLDLSRPCGRLLENPKAGGSRELFLPENDFKTSSIVLIVNFPKKHPDFQGMVSKWLSSPPTKC